VERGEARGPDARGEREERRERGETRGGGEERGEIDVEPEHPAEPPPERREGTLRPAELDVEERPRRVLPHAADDGAERVVEGAQVGAVPPDVHRVRREALEHRDRPVEPERRLERERQPAEAGSCVAGGGMADERAGGGARGSGAVTCAARGAGAVAGLAGCGCCFVGGSIVGRSGAGRVASCASQRRRNSSGRSSSFGQTSFFVTTWVQRMHWWSPPATCRTHWM